MFLSLRRTLMLLVALAASTSATITLAEIAQKSAQGLSLIELQPHAEPVWMTQQEKSHLMRTTQGFFDVTATYDPVKAAVLRSKQDKILANTEAPQSFTYPSGPTKQTQVKQLFNQVSIDNIKTIVTHLSSFYTRFHLTETGIQASQWIRDKLLEGTYPGSGATVSFFNHTSTPQSSVIARIPGSDLTAPIVVLSAHLDSINHDNDDRGRAPGADDDATGTSNMMEAFRVLVANKFKPKATVEFHLYAGEEGGMLGSGEIVKSYYDNGVKVAGVLHYDMTGWVRPGTAEVFNLMPDYTNSNLTSYVATLIDTYSRFGWTITAACPSPCSDHATWFKYGYPTALPHEGTMPDNSNLDVHTDRDTVDLPGFSWLHAHEFSKLAVAFAYELGTA